jgi:putative redox protein
VSTEAKPRPNTARLELESVAQGLRFRAVAGSGQSTILDSGPGMVAPSPIEMLLISLASCHAMDVIAILRKKRQEVTGYVVEVVGERRAEPPRSFTRIEMVHRVTGRDVSLKALKEAVELSETKYCSVHHSLDPKIEIVSRCEVMQAG